MPTTLTAALARNARRMAQRICQSADQYHRDGDYAAFTVRQRMLWDTVDGLGPRMVGQDRPFADAVRDALREV